jgi:hypothetical protein
VAFRAHVSLRQPLASPHQVGGSSLFDITSFSSLIKPESKIYFYKAILNLLMEEIAPTEEDES